MTRGHRASFPGELAEKQPPPRTRRGVRVLEVSPEACWGPCSVPNSLAWRRVRTAPPANESTESLDEAALVTQLKAGDAAAFERLVRLHSPHLLAVARRFLSSEDDAQDAVQDTFLAAFRAIGKFVGHARLSTWLHRIVVNASLMKLRTRRRRPEHSIEELLPSFLDDGHQVRPTSFWNESRFGDAEIGETRDLVISSIKKLPEAYRTVLMMRDIEEMDTAETARQLNLSEAAVKTRLHRARQALRTLLDPYFREPKP